MTVIGTVAACTPGDRGFGFSIDAIEIRAARGAAELVVRQRIVLSDEAREALVHGVPLVFRLEARLRPGSGGAQVEVARAFELSYLPLSDHYRLAAAAGPAASGAPPTAPARTYPRLRHALADLAEVTLPLPAGFDVRQTVEIMARSHLAEGELPPPMRLPAWLSARWQHDSGWQSRSVAPPESA